MTKQSPTCLWSQEDDIDSDFYGTSCGHYFSIIDGTPNDNGFKFCVFCGKPIEQSLITEVEE